MKFLTNDEYTNLSERANRHKLAVEEVLGKYDTLAGDYGKLYSKNSNNEITIKALRRELSENKRSIFAIMIDKISGAKKHE